MRLFFISAIQADNERETVPDNRRNLTHKLHMLIFNIVTHSGWNTGNTASMPVTNISKVTISFIVIIFGR